MRQRKTYKISSAERTKRRCIKLVIDEIRTLQRTVEDINAQGKLFDDGIDETLVNNATKQIGYLYNLMYYLRRFKKDKAEHKPVDTGSNSDDFVKDLESDDGRGELFGKVAREEYDKENLTEWELGFLESFKERIMRYGNRTYMSDKQRTILERILNRKGDDNG